MSVILLMTALYKRITAYVTCQTIVMTLFF